MIPHIEFRYSWIYDQNMREWSKSMKFGQEKYPNQQKVMEYIPKVERLWRKKEKTILKELSKISKLSWKEKKIICYIVGRSLPFSDPLTLPIYQKHINRSIDVLVHELIHQLFTQEGNTEKSEKSWNYIWRKYKKYSIRTKVHVPLHAIHEHIYKKFFDERRLKIEIWITKNYPDYKNAWDIVQKEGYKNILQEWRSRIK
ncbi:MAG: hypothetical protein AABW65_01290 [Nanoarchaeota archaeon]|mgnify:CR=1 FL=1